MPDLSPGPSRTTRRLAKPRPIHSPTSATHRCLLRATEMLKVWVTRHSYAERELIPEQSQSTVWLTVRRCNRIMEHSELRFTAKPCESWGGYQDARPRPLRSSAMELGRRRCPPASHPQVPHVAGLSICCNNNTNLLILAR